MQHSTVAAFRRAHVADRKIRHFSRITARPITIIVSMDLSHTSLAVTLNASCHVISCHIMLSYVMQSHVMLSYVMSSDVTLCYLISSHVMLSHITAESRYTIRTGWPSTT